MFNFLIKANHECESTKTELLLKNRDIIYALSSTSRIDFQALKLLTRQNNLTELKLKNEIKITNFVIIRDHLVKRALIEFNHPEDPKYNSYTINYENYESVNGILMPKKITAMLSEETIIVTEFSDVQFNLGVSDFFFKAQSL